MKATIWAGRNSVEVQSVPDPQILNDRDAIVRITSTAICGSDLHLYEGYIPTVKRGDVLGHEFMGEVVEVGKAVKNLSAGAEHAPHAIGNGTTTRSTGYMGAEMCDITPGDVVAVWGAGPVGLFSVMSAYLLGASKVVAVDRVPYRLELAQKIGAMPVNFEETSVLEELQHITAGRGPDHCIDAAGMEARNGTTLVDAYDRAKRAMRLETERPRALREAAMSCRNGGTISIIGV